MPSTRRLTNWSARLLKPTRQNWRRSAFHLGEVQRIHQRRRADRGIGERFTKSLRARGLGDYARIDYHVIRGLAYYTGVVFEAFDKKGRISGHRRRRALR